MMRHSKNIYAVVLGILSTIALHAMEQTVATVDHSRAQRMVQLKSLLLQKMPLPKETLRRSFDNVYGNDGFHNYLKFSSDGQYLIEARPNNLADFTITNMETRQSNCYLISGSSSLAGSLHVTCKGHDLIVANHKKIFKIDMTKNCVVENFSQKTDGLIQPPRYLGLVEDLAYNPASSQFVSRTRFSNREDFYSYLLCMHDSDTGVVTASYQQNLGTLSFSPDGQYFTTPRTKLIAVHDGKTGKVKYERVLQSYSRGVAWHPQACFFVVAYSDDTVDNRTHYGVFDGPTGNIITTFFDDWKNKHNVGSDCFFIEFSHDGKYFITINTCSGNINIRDGKAFNLVDSISAPLLYDSNSDYKMAINSDSTYLVFGAKEQNSPEAKNQNIIVLYDLEEHKIVTRIPVNNLSHLEWRPGTNQFISTSTGSTEVTVWNFFDYYTTDALKNLEGYSTTQQIELVIDLCSGKKSIEQDMKMYNTLPGCVQFWLPLATAEQF